MSPDALMGRLKKQDCDCEHNAKLHIPGICAECTKKRCKPFTVFLLCLKDNSCCEKQECGYHWGPGSEKCGQPIKQG